MRQMLPIVAVLAVMPSLATAQAPPARAPLTSAAEFNYRLEAGDLAYDDLLTLNDGRKMLGKVMEWADQILLFRGPGEPQCFGVESVREFNLRRVRRHLRKPAAADLTIAYIERTPRDASLQGRIKIQEGVFVLDGENPPALALPPAGSKVTFRVHVVNGGGAKSGAAECILTAGNAPLAKVKIDPLGPGETKVVQAEWAWQSGQRVRAEIKPLERFDEVATWNNVLEDPCDAVGVTVLVDAKMYEKYRTVRNIVDTFTIEDWIQYQLRVFNGLLAASIYPTSPQGVLERVRCDRIIVFAGGVEDYLLEAERKGESPGAVRLLLDSPLSGSRSLVDAATRVDWNLQQELGRQLGLVNWSATDTTLEQCMVRTGDVGYLQLQHLFPYRNTLMCTAGGYRLSEVDAAYLNSARGLPRGSRGELLYQLPGAISIKLISNAGTPLSGVDIDGFQLMSQGDLAGTIAGAGGSDPLFTLTTDTNGHAVLPSQEVSATKTAGGQELKPNAFGRIVSDGSNGLLLLRLHKGGYEEYHFIRLFDCLVGRLRGSKDEYVHAIETRFSTAEAPNSPLYTNSLPRPDGGFYCSWLMPPGTLGRNLAEFRVYKRVGLAGLDARPWTLDAICRSVNGKWTFEADVDCFRDASANGAYGLDTFAASAFVDKDGRESAPAGVPAFYSHGRDVVAMAVTPEHQVYMSTTGIGEQRMLGWSGTAGTQPLGFRHRIMPTYQPAFAGVAIAQDRKVIVTDPVNHVLAIYDRGDLVNTIPSREQWPGTSSDANGEFKEPMDAAVDDEGRIYVADRGNNRVQILDANGVFVDLLDPELEGEAPAAAPRANPTEPQHAPAATQPALTGFVAPDGVGYSNGHICVTDMDGTRVRVYNVKGAKPKYEYQATKLLNADRGLINRDGDLFVLGQSPFTKEWGVMIFDRDGEKARYRSVRATAEGEIGNVDRPRGFCYFTTQDIEYGYFINAAPFNLRRTFLMKEMPAPGQNPPPNGANPAPNEANPAAAVPPATEQQPAPTQG